MSSSVETVQKASQDHARSINIQPAKALFKNELWQQVIEQGAHLLQSAIPSDPAKAAEICDLISSSYFRLGGEDNISLCIKYAQDCRKYTQNPLMHVRSQLLESAGYRSKKDFSQALQIIKEALLYYQVQQINDSLTFGKIYFNWAAALADNPQPKEGDYKEAVEHYQKALQTYKEKPELASEVKRVEVRLNDLHVKMNKLDLVKPVEVFHENTRLQMHAELSEARRLAALKSWKEALNACTSALAKAQLLNAQDDEARIRALQTEIHSKSAEGKEEG